MTADPGALEGDSHVSEERIAAGQFERR